MNDSNLKKLLKRFEYGNIVYDIVFIVIALVMIFKNQEFTIIITRILGAITIYDGILRVTSYYKLKDLGLNAYSYNLNFGIISILIGLFLSISCYLILTGLNFIGLAYLLVYIGAVSILFLFILMLINVRISELLIDSLNSIPLALLIGSFFNYFVNNVLPYMVIAFNNLLFYVKTTTKLANVTSVSWDGYLAETSHIASIGNILYGNYSI